MLKYKKEVGKALGIKRFEKQQKKYFPNHLIPLRYGKTIKTKRYET